MKETPLHKYHLTKQAKMVDFSGWAMPVSYSSILKEHLVVRDAVGLFDVSHMGEFIVKGKGAGAFLDGLLTRPVSKMKAGSAKYVLMCYSDGGVVDDLLVYCLGEEDYFLCVNAANIDKDFKWLKDHLVAGVDLEDVSAQYTLLALQGPQAASVIEGVYPQAVDLKRFKFWVSDEGLPAIVSRTGYTGEDGFELYLPITVGCQLWEQWMEQVTLCGLGARDSLRLEAGLSLYGHEISEHINPIQAGLGFAVDLKSERSFLGKEALIAEPRESQVVHFVLEGRQMARAGEVVHQGDRAVGEVLSGAFSPVLQKPVGSALVSTLDDLSVILRGNRVGLQLKQPPLHKV